MTFGAVIFDLDGVLVDSEIRWDEVRADFAARHGRGWDLDDRAAMMGANSRQWSNEMRTRLALELPAEEIEREIVERVVARYRDEGPPLIAGAIETVRRIARDLPVAVASSAHPAVIDAALGALGLAGAFRVVVSSDEVAFGKPSPDVYLEAARRLGIAPERCLVVEDSLNGVRAGRAAGMTVVLVPNVSVPPAPGTHDEAHHVAPAIAEVLRLLQLPDPDGVAAVELPGPPVAPLLRTIRYWFTCTIARLLIGSMTRVRLVGADRLPPGPAILCFNHQSWADPFVLMAALPARPRLYFFGPRERDMRVGFRNRLMAWVGTTVPFSPDRRDMAAATRTVGRVCRAGARLAIAGEGTIHVGERVVLPLSQGPAFFAQRFGVPLVPVAVNGTGWLGFGRTVRVTVGEPLVAEGPGRAAVRALTAGCEDSLRSLVADFPDRPAPGPFGRWLTELFNVWPDGRRPEPPDREPPHLG